jgi:flagella basal body P-ring formation protein FlgA
MSGGRIVPFLLAVVLWGVCVSGGIAFADTNEDTIADFVQKIYGDNEVQVTFSRLPQLIRDNARIKNISFAKVPDVMGDGICLVAVEGHNGSCRNLYVPFKVQAKRTLYTLKHNVKKGDAISIDDIAAKETFLQGGLSVYPSEARDIVGKVAKKELMAGEVITNQILEELVMVAKGETICMTVEKKNLFVQGKGVALEKGKLGDVIRVKSLSGREVIARVTGNGSVSVEF